MGFRTFCARLLYGVRTALQGNSKALGDDIAVRRFNHRKRGLRRASVVVVLSLAAALAFAVGPAARAQDDDCTPTYQLWLLGWVSFLTDPSTPQPPLPDPSDACYGAASQAVQDALAAWNASRIAALLAVASANPSPTPQGPAARTVTPVPAGGTPQSIAPPAACTQAQFVVAPPAIRPGEATVIVITGFAPGSPAMLTISGRTSRQVLTVPVVATAECAVVIGGDAAAHLPPDAYQLQVNGTGYSGRPLEMVASLTIR